MAHTRNWNAAYEALPADGDQISAGAGRIRNERTDIRERMETDHYMALAGTQADHGEHKKITFHEPITKPSSVANKGFLYGKDASGKIELHWEDEDGNELQITSAGALNGAIASTTKMLFYQDTAPTGWTIDATVDDKLVFVSKGSAAGGQTGGAAHSTGTWTQPNHTHAGGTLQVSTTVANSGWSYDTTGTAGYLASSYPGSAIRITAARAFTSGYPSGATAAGATANTWRPASYVCIIATKD